MGEFVRAVSKSELSENEGKVVEVKGKQIAVFHVKSEFCAIDNTCPHRGGPLGEGSLEGTVVTCPWHGWKFDVTTGVSPLNPEAKVQKFNCKVEGNDVCVEL